MELLAVYTYLYIQFEISRLRIRQCCSRSLRDLILSRHSVMSRESNLASRGSLKLMVLEH